MLTGGEESLPPLTRRLIGWEIVVVFAVSLGGSALNAVIDLIGSLTATKSLGKQPAEKWLMPAGYEAMFREGGNANQAMSCLIEPNCLPELDRMCMKHPDTPVIIDHLCRIGMDGTVRDGDVTILCDMARHKKIMVKVGAFYALGKKEPPYTDLAPLIRPGDALLTEVSFGPAAVAPGAFHLNAPAVAELAAERRPGRVLLTHLQMGHDADETIAIVRASYDGPVDLMRPGLRLDLSR